MTTENSVMTPKDVAKETNTSLRIIYKYLRKGVIPHVHLGDKYLIGRKAFEAWVNGSQVQSK